MSKLSWNQFVYTPLDEGEWEVVLRVLDEAVQALPDSEATKDCQALVRLGEILVRNKRKEIKDETIHAVDVQQISIFVNDQLKRIADTIAAVSQAHGTYAMMGYDH